MASASRDRITLDLRGMGTALQARASGQGVSPSHFARVAIATALGSDEAATDSSPYMHTEMISNRDRVKFTLRLTAAEALGHREFVLTRLYESA